MVATIKRNILGKAISAAESWQITVDTVKSWIGFATIQWEPIRVRNPVNTIRQLVCCTIGALYLAAAMDCDRIR
jgi:hypothetical protein